MKLAGFQDWKPESFVFGRKYDGIGLLIEVAGLVVVGESEVFDVFGKTQLPDESL